MPAAKGLSPWSAIVGTEASGTGQVEVTGAPSGRQAIAIEGTTIIAGTESSTTSGNYLFARSDTTAAKLMYFIL